MVNTYLNAIDATRTEMLRTVAALDPEEQVWRATDSTWSAVEIIEHLVLAEQVVLGDVRTASTRVPHTAIARDRVRALIVWAVLRFGVRVSVPSESMRPSGAVSFSELRAQWIEQHQMLRAFAESLDARGRRKRVFRHPIAGPLNVLQALQLLDAHLRTHQRQLARVLDALRRAARHTPQPSETTDAPTPQH